MSAPGPKEEEAPPLHYSFASSGAAVFSQVPATKGAAPNSQGTAQMLRQECQSWAGPGHRHQECPLTEVEQVFCLADCLTPSPSPEWTYCMLVRCQGYTRQLDGPDPSHNSGDRFNNLLEKCVGMRSQPSVACTVCAALSGDPRLSNADSGEEETEGAPCEAPPPWEISH